MLRENGALNIREIGEYTHFQESFICYSLGWLAREDKILFYEKEGMLYIKLEDVAPGW
ncbi:MAG: winged helix-turn-helix domain-containing protein [Prevotellaceae bacterium]|nr:winged helix-turn-helix domain-containing protein [Prevotellaceae bacterium]